MDKYSAIGVLDSGVGGLTVLKELEKSLPSENKIYFGDSLRMPYGNKSEEEIIFLANEMISFLEKRNVKVILLACNTISSYIDKISSNVPLFSIVKSGSKAIYESHTKNTVGLIATKATVNSKSYERELYKLKKDIKIISKDSTKLPKVIDKQIENTPLLNDLIKECIDPILKEDKNIKELVLGCSHFPIIEKEIKAIYKDLTLLDPAKKMVEDTMDYLKKEHLLNDSTDKRTSLYTTEDILEFVAYIKRLSLNIDKLEKVKLLKDD